MDELTDLRERLERASRELQGLMTAAPSREERARLAGKRQGVELALSYIHDAERLSQ